MLSNYHLFTNAATAQARARAEELQQTHHVIWAVPPFNKRSMPQDWLDQQPRLTVVHIRTFGVRMEALYKEIMAFKTNVRKVPTDKYDGYGPDKLAQNRDALLFEALKQYKNDHSDDPIECEAVEHLNQSLLVIREHAPLMKAGGRGAFETMLRALEKLPWTTLELDVPEGKRVHLDWTQRLDYNNGSFMCMLGASTALAEHLVKLPFPPKPQEDLMHNTMRFYTKTFPPFKIPSSIHDLVALVHVAFAGRTDDEDSADVLCDQLKAYLQHLRNGSNSLPYPPSGLTVDCEDDDLDAVAHVQCPVVFMVPTSELLDRLKPWVERHRLGELVLDEELTNADKVERALERNE